MGKTKGNAAQCYLYMEMEINKLKTKNGFKLLVICIKAIP